MRSLFRRLIFFHAFFIGLLCVGSSRGADDEAERRTTHFRFLYDPTRLTVARVDEAEREAESAFVELSHLFPEVKYERPITVRLDARFKGATGYASPGGPGGKSDTDAIGLRYENLDHLGLTPRFLFRHELTHLFVGRWENGRPSPRLSGSFLGEGIADLVADGRNGLGLPLSFARTIMDRDYWTPPERLFLLAPRTGLPFSSRKNRLDYRDVLRWRIEKYVEPSLFLSFVRSRIGWEGMRAFFIDYANAGAARNHADQFRRVIRRHLKLLPEDLFEEWRREIRSAPPDPADQLRWLSEKTYSAVQWYEFLAAGKAIAPEACPPIEEDLRRIHASLGKQRYEEAEIKLDTVLRAIEKAADGRGSRSSSALDEDAGESAKGNRIITFSDRNADSVEWLARQLTTRCRFSGWSISAAYPAGISSVIGERCGISLSVLLSVMRPNGRLLPLVRERCGMRSLLVLAGSFSPLPAGRPPLPATVPRPFSPLPTWSPFPGDGR